MDYLPFRPQWCPDSECRCIWTTWTGQSHLAGFSSDCVGELPEPHEFKWRSTVHVNPYCWCLNSPLKGVVKFLIQDKDVAVFFGTLGALLLEVNPQELGIILRPLVVALQERGIVLGLESA